MPRPIGLHLRLTNSFMDAVDQALVLETPIFQCFLIDQVHRTRVIIDRDTVIAFNGERRQFEHVFIHASYWINLANLGTSGYRILKKELYLAQKLDIKQVIFHPGSAATVKDRQEGINAVATALNEMNKMYPAITLVLENTSHGGKTVGSDLHDLYAIKQRLEFPDRVAFCIDTAHAYAYGYDVSDVAKQQQFIELIDTTIGIDRLVLIHLNDSVHPLGSRIDKHAPVGQGLIGSENLKAFVLSERLAHLPLILELPMVSPEQEYTLLREVRNWHL